MMRRVLALAISGLSFFALSAPQLSAKFGQYTSYFVDEGKFRHLRFESLLKQSLAFTPSLTSVGAVRLRADAALHEGKWSPHHDYSQAVRDDEGLEADLRLLYLDYLSDSFRLKAGMLQIDWVESLSPFASDLLTPMDLRFGGFGSGEDNLIPQVSLLFNHKLGEGSLEWLVTALPRSSRLPLGENGYGYSQYLSSFFSGTTALSSPGIARRLDETEFGVRYLRNISGFDLSLLAFRGHQRVPSLRVVPLSATAVNVIQETPRIWTLGVASAYSHESWVGRLFAYFEPQRSPRAFIDTPGANHIFTARRTRVGGGFDYLFSRDLKVYSEFFGNRFDEKEEDNSANVVSRSTHHDYVATIRLTNETLDNFTLSLNSTLGFPETSWTINPEVMYQWETVKVTSGYRWIHSDSRDSAFEILKNASQWYLQLVFQEDLLS